MAMRSLLLGLLVRISVVVLVIACTGERALAADSITNAACQECHADVAKLEPKKRVDPTSLVVDGAAFAHSEHHHMVCVDCHVDMTKTLPHPEVKPRVCLDCHHGDDSKTGGVSFGAIARDFAASVHVDRTKGAFSCTQCHDPHKMTRSITEQGLEGYNRMCLRCHASAKEFQRLVAKPPSDLEKAHSWLPNREMHWRQVRCVDCHSSYDPLSYHLILPKEKAVKKCEACHSANTVLSLKLYAYKRDTELAKVGFLNGAIVNDAYVVGATRMVLVDRIVMILGALMFTGIAGHLAVRGLATRRREGKQPKEPHADDEHVYRGKAMFPIWLRAWHWVNAALFFVLLATGLSMHFAGAFTGVVSLRWAVRLHNISGVLLAVAYAFFLVVIVKSGHWRQYLPETKPKNYYLQGRFYLYGIFRGEHHPFPATAKARFNPLQKASYFFVVLLAYPVQTITGVFLLYPGSAPETVAGFGGILPMAVAHTLFSYALVLFLIVHVYLALTVAEPHTTVGRMILGDRPVPPEVLPPDEAPPVIEAPPSAEVTEAAPRRDEPSDEPPPKREGEEDRQD